MAIFRPNSNRQQDIGGVYSEPGKIPSHIDTCEVSGELIDNDYPKFSCETCIVNESGVEYSQNSSGCYIIPSFPDVTVSGVDICSFISTNCPAISGVSFNTGTQALTFTKQNGATVSQTITVNTSGCVTGTGTTADPIRFNGDILTVNAGTTATTTDAANGTAGVGCGEILHFYSSDSNINVNVSEGSARVNLGLANPATAVFNATGLTVSGNDGAGVQVDICCLSGIDVSGNQLTVTEVRNGVNTPYVVSLPSNGTGSLSVVTQTPSGFIHFDGSGTTVGVDVCSLVQTSCGATAISNASGVTISGNDGAGVQFNTAQISGVNISGATLTITDLVNGSAVPFSATLPGSSVSFDGSGLTVSGSDGTSANVDICCISGFQTVGTNLVLTEVVNGSPVIRTAAIPTVSGTTSDSVSVMLDTPSGFIHNDGSGTTYNFDACAKINAQCPATVTNNASGLTISGTDGTSTQIDVCCPSGFNADGSGNVVATYFVNGATQTYTFPVGGDVVTGGCLTGSGTVAQPLNITLAPSGNLICTSSGLAVSGVQTDLSVTGCLFGSGTVASPLGILVHPTGGLACDVSGLRLGGSGCSLAVSHQSGSCPSGVPATPANPPTAAAVSGTVLIETYVDCHQYWTFDGSGWILDQRILSTSGGTGITSVETGSCLTGSGLLGQPIELVLAPNGNIACSSSGLAVSGITVSVTGSVTGDGSASQPLNVAVEPSGGLQTSTSGLRASLETDGCVTGLGTSGSPLSISLNPTGNLICTSNGLAVSGLNISNSVITSGCITGSGTVGSPIELAIAPNSNLVCSSSGLAVSGITVSVTGSIAGDGSAAQPLNVLLEVSGGLQQNAASGLRADLETTGCVTGLGTGASPLSLALNPTGNLICTSNGLAVSGISAGTVVVSGCLTGSGTVGAPLEVQLNPTGNLICTSNGLAVSGVSGLCTSVSEEITGSGTQATPTTACNIVVTQPCAASGTVTIDNRQMVYFELGQGGFLIADSAIDEQHRFVVPEGYQMEVVRAYYSLGAVSPSGATTVDFYATQGTNTGALPTAGAAAFSLNIPVGSGYGDITALNGTYNGLVHIQERISTAGAGAKDLNIQVWGKICPIQ